MSENQKEKPIEGGERGKTAYDGWRQEGKGSGMASMRWLQAELTLSKLVWLDRGNEFVRDTTGEKKRGGGPCWGVSWGW